MQTNIQAFDKWEQFNDKTENVIYMNIFPDTFQLSCKILKKLQNKRRDFILAAANKNDNDAWNDNNDVYFVDHECNWLLLNMH